MATDPKSAKGGKCSWLGVDVEHVHSVQMTETTVGEEFRTSSTAGETGRVAGHNDSNVTVELYNEGGEMAIPFRRGVTGALAGYTDTSHNLNGTFLVMSVATNITISGGLVGSSIALSQTTGPNTLV